MQIEISEKNAIVIVEFIYRRYYFGLFKDITRDEEQEYKIRDAILEVAAAIEYALENK